jgi:hypothetical protein
MLRSNVDPIGFARDMVRLRRPLRLRGRWRPPQDGLYRVATSRKVHGGFLVQRRRVTRASPYVRRYIHILAMRNAEFVGSLEALLSQPLRCGSHRHGVDSYPKASNSGSEPGNFGSLVLRDAIKQLHVQRVAQRGFDFGA